jgi:hypothetical protein
MTFPLLNGSNRCSLALSDAASAASIDAIASTAKLCTPPVSEGQGAPISTQPSAATEASDVQDVVAAIIENVAAAAEGKVPLHSVDPLSSTQQRQQTEASQHVLAESNSLHRAYPPLRPCFEMFSCLLPCCIVPSRVMCSLKRQCLIVSLQIRIKQQTCCANKSWTSHFHTFNASCDSLCTGSLHTVLDSHVYVQTTALVCCFAEDIDHHLRVNATLQHSGHEKCCWSVTCGRNTAILLPCHSNSSCLFD